MSSTLVTDIVEGRGNSKAVRIPINVSGSQYINDMFDGGYDVIAKLLTLSTYRINLLPSTTEPDHPQEGDIVLADGLTWDPLSLSPSAGYLIWYRNSLWRAIEDKAAG